MAMTEATKVRNPIAPINVASFVSCAWAGQVPRTEEWVSLTQAFEQNVDSGSKACYSHCKLERMLPSSVKPPLRYAEQKN